jgi:DNA-binding IclR family transcriptional regulator
MTPDNPSLTLKELEDLLAVPREHLEFTLWFLKESQYIQRTDNGRHSITIKGVELAEEMNDRRPEPLPMIAASTLVA